jgi:hypothetical protein
MPSISIHTLNARDNVMLDVATQLLSLTPSQIQREIRGLVTQTAEILNTKGVPYAGLRNALVPQRDRREVLLVFDRAQIDSGWYSRAIWERLLPLFRQQGSHSVLEGDYLGGNRSQDMLREELMRDMVPGHYSEYMQSNQYFLVYVNNLSDTMVDHFHNGLSDYEPYTGFVDVTFSSWLKTYVSTILVNSFLLHRRHAIMSHEDGEDNSQNQNSPGYPFEENGFLVRSLESMYFDLLLSYKIERRVLPGSESDTTFSLNAISTDPASLASFEIQVEPGRLDYLVREKEGVMKRAGLLNATAAELEKRIRQQIFSNYIYETTYDEVHGTAKFNVLVEMEEEGSGKRQRVKVVLEYLPDDKRLKLITLF